MGGRGSMSGVSRISDNAVFVNKYSRRLTKDEITAAVQDKANFIFRELKADPAIQVIIRRSFVGGVPTVKIENSGLIQKGWTSAQADNVLRSVQAWINKYNSEYRQETRISESYTNISDRQQSAAKRQAIEQARKELEKAKRNIKKNYKL